MAKFKALKFKELPDTFGSFMDVGGGSEIVHSTTPYLFPLTATIEDMKEYLGPSAGLAFTQLDQYDMVEVEVIVAGENVKSSSL